MTKTDIAQILSSLMLAYQSFKPVDIQAVAELWLTILGDLPADTVKAAALQYMSEAHDFPPSPGRLREMAISLLIHKSGIPTAYEAYQQVLAMPPDMLRKEAVVLEDGQWSILVRPLRFNHPLVERVARMLGWPERFPSDNPTADFAQFERVYNAELDRYRREQYALPALRAFIPERTLPESTQSLPEPAQSPSAQIMISAVAAKLKGERV
jgi:hypothetical protein